MGARLAKLAITAAVVVKTVSAFAPSQSLSRVKTATNAITVGVRRARFCETREQIHASAALSLSRPQPRNRFSTAQSAASSSSKCSACGATVGAMEFHSCSQMAARSVEASFAWGSRLSAAQHPLGCVCSSCA